MGSCIDIVPPFGIFGCLVLGGVVRWFRGFVVGWERDAVRSGCAKPLEPRRLRGRTLLLAEAREQRPAADAKGEALPKWARYVLEKGEELESQARLLEGAGAIRYRDGPSSLGAQEPTLRHTEKTANI